MTYPHNEYDATQNAPTKTVSLVGTLSPSNPQLVRLINTTQLMVTVSAWNANRKRTPTAVFFDMKNRELWAETFNRKRPLQEYIQQRLDASENKTLCLLSNTNNTRPINVDTVVTALKIALATLNKAEGLSNVDKQ